MVPLKDCWVRKLPWQQPDPSRPQFPPEDRKGDHVMTDTTDMQGKTVLITGGSSGVGLVSARELARPGARIDPTDRDRSRTNSESGQPCLETALCVVE